MLKLLEKLPRCIEPRTQILAILQLELEGFSEAHCPIPKA